MVTTARRRVPPRGNPEPQPQPTMATYGSTTPWGTVIATTAAITITGYIVSELLRSAHQAFQRRRAERSAMKENASRIPAHAPAGPRADGTFALPRPGNFGFPGNPYAYGPAANQPPVYAAPRPGNLVDVSTAEGQLRNELYDMRRELDAKFARLERLLPVGPADGHEGVG